MLHLTYELYLEGEDGLRRFQALTCLEADLMPQVRRVMARERSRAVEVWRLGERLFTLQA